MFLGRFMQQAINRAYRKIGAVLLLMAFLASPTIALDAVTPARPDIVVLLLDDMRYDQWTAAGHPYIQTPNFDELAKRGVVLDRMYVTSPVCGPSRASMLTGRMPSTHGRLNNLVWPEQLGGAYLPSVFHQAGYRTAIIGKDYEKQSVDMHREQSWTRQFLLVGPTWPAESKGFTPQQRKDYYETHEYYDQEYELDGKKQTIPGHQTDVVLDELQRFALESTDPYFAFVCPFAPHTPWNPSKERLGKYTGKGVPPRPDLELDALPPAKRKMATDGHERTAEMIEDVDAALGRVVKALRDAGRLEQTIIIITSDNGTMLGEKGLLWKQRPYEICERVPMIWFGPGADQLKEAGVLDQPVSQADILPTLAAMVGAPLPEDDRRYGKSMLEPRDNVLVMQYPFDINNPDIVPNSLAWASLVGKRYKLTLRAQDALAIDPYAGPAVELFDLSKDPYEMHNLAQSDPDGMLATMKEALMQQLHSHGAEIKLSD